MTDEPCTESAATWDLHKACPKCQHSGWFHPAGGAGKFRQCLICNLTLLESALIARESGLRKREAELDALKSELEYELMRVKAITHGARPGTWVPTLAHGDVFVP